MHNSKEKTRVNVSIDKPDSKLSVEEKMALLDSLVGILPKSVTIEDGVEARIHRHDYE